MLLFDQNISFRIVSKLQSIFAKCNQVRNLGLEDSSDSDIWDFAKNNSYIIVSFDADFADIASIKGAPPKIIWLRTGNMTTNYIALMLEKHQDIIHRFISDNEFREIVCLEIEQ